MVFFFALAMKEVFEAMLPGGPLSSPREGAVPILAAVGGMTAPATIYLLSIWALGMPDLHAGWAIPCATDIAFSYLAARLIFPRGSPAIPFLLLLAIADDALGLVVLAIFYPSGVVSLTLLAALLIPGMLLAWGMRRFGIQNFWLYVFGPGLLSWLGMYYGGLHPALALVPIIPLMPHHKSDLKVFGRQEPVRLMTLHHFEQWWKVPVQFVLLAFGLVNAGVPFSAVGPISWVVLRQPRRGQADRRGWHDADRGAHRIPAPARPRLPIARDVGDRGRHRLHGRAVLRDRRVRSRRAPVSSTKPRWARCSASSPRSWRSASGGRSDSGREVQEPGALTSGPRTASRRTA